MATANYYRLFALQPTASAVEIKQRYRQLSLRFHPDRGGSAEEMARINEAYRVLSNGLLRREYDRQYTEAHTATPMDGDVFRSRPYQPQAAAYEAVRRQRAAEQERYYYRQPAPPRPQASSFWVWMAAMCVVATGFLAYQFYDMVRSDVVPDSNPAASSSFSSGSVPTTTTEPVQSGASSINDNSSAGTSPDTSTYRYYDYRSYYTNNMSR